MCTGGCMKSKKRSKAVLEGLKGSVVRKMFIGQVKPDIKKGRNLLDVRLTPDLYSGQHSGFTLIELLVVVLIIGILASIAIPQYQKAVARSRFAALKSMTQAMANAEEMYYLANGSYTMDTEALSMEIPAKHNDGRTFYFDWGYCIFTIGFDTSPRVACQNDSIHLNYQIHLLRSSDTNAGKTRCTVTDNYALGHQVCKSETGKKVPDLDYPWGVSYFY